jgi:hypothetical protein
LLPGQRDGLVRLGVGSQRHVVCVRLFLHMIEVLPQAGLLDEEAGRGERIEWHGNEGWAGVNDAVVPSSRGLCNCSDATVCLSETERTQDCCPKLNLKVGHVFFAYNPTVRRPASLLAPSIHVSFQSHVSQTIRSPCATQSPISSPAGPPSRRPAHDGSSGGEL